MSDTEMVIRLFLAVLLGGVVGLERERHGRAAGLRTHILVCVSAALVMSLSLFLHEKYHSDPANIAAHVVSGIGFLGAGTILRFKVSIKGLTTAASLWAVSCIGLAVGAGFYFGAMITTAVVLGALFWLTKIAEKVLVHKEWFRILTLEMIGAFEGLQKVRDVLDTYQAEIKDFNVTKLETGNVAVALEVRLLSPREEEPILKELMGVEGVKRAFWKEA